MERILALGAAALIGLVWVVSGIRAQADLMPAVQQALPGADHFKPQGNGIYAAYGDSTEQNLVGYVAIGTASGYGGPLEIAVAVDLQGQITGLALASEKETPAWLEHVMDTDLLQSLTGKLYTDPFRLGVDVDAVTGATYTARALAEAALDGSRQAARLLGLSIQESPPPQIVFDVPELVVLALFAVGYVGHKQNFRYKKPVRWGSMLVGLVVLGFIYNLPITLSFFTKLILGYWPEWQTNLYWYFLLGGILFVFTVDNKNPYCEWFCPFGAAQECMGIIGGAKVRTPRRHRGWLKWLQRGLALGAMLLGVYFRSPGLAGYELFGTLFNLLGTGVQFLALGLVLLAALYMRRPWCAYLCPISPVVEWIRIMRAWVIESWHRIAVRITAA